MLNFLVYSPPQRLTYNNHYHFYANCAEAEQRNVENGNTGLCGQESILKIFYGGKLYTKCFKVSSQSRKFEFNVFSIIH